MLISYMHLCVLELTRESWWKFVYILFPYFDFAGDWMPAIKRRTNCRSVCYTILRHYTKAFWQLYSNIMPSF